MADYRQDPAPQGRRPGNRQTQTRPPSRNDSKNNTNSTAESNAKNNSKNNTKSNAKNNPKSDSLNTKKKSRKNEKATADQNKSVAPESKPRTPAGSKASAGRRTPAGNNPRTPAGNKPPADNRTSAGMSRVPYGNKQGSGSYSYQAPGYRTGGAQPNAARYGIQAQGRSINMPNKTKGGPWRIVFWVALIVFLASLIALGVIAYSYLQGQNTYKEVASEVGFSVTSDFDGMSLEDMKVDWDALKAKNPETVGWIYIPNTMVNYPIVQAKDNEKYLTTDFNGDKGWLANYGAIFMAAENSPDFSDPNNIIYGHHMNDGSMFACVDGFRDVGEFNSHRDIYILTPEGNYRLTSFSLVICGGDDPLAQPQFASNEEMQAYIEDKMSRNVVDPSPNAISASEMKKIFALVTCDYTIDDGRAVLFASVVESTVPAMNSGDESQSLVNPEDVTSVEDATKEI